MHESTADIAWLQALLDDSYARSGRHLAEIHSLDVRLSPDEVIAHLQGMNIFVVATTNSTGRVFTGPVDGFFFKARVHFGTAPTALRARHLNARPTISATHVLGESIVVTVHGTAVPLDLTGRDADFTAVTRAYYGTGWDEWDGPPAAWLIEPDRMFASDMSKRRST